jgi:RNA polymerase sigma-70 factor, ECF subfamily
MNGSEDQLDAAKGEVTELLKKLKDGNPDASSELIVLVYEELRRLGAHYMRQERPDHTLQSTALVHEAYMRLVEKPEGFNNRAHFFAVAAQAMRHILVDHARARQAGKRGGADKQQVELKDALAVTTEDPEMMLALDQALTRLAEFDQRKARVVELIYFAGLKREEVAAILEIAPETVTRDWNHARAWLHSQLAQPAKTSE